MNERRSAGVVLAGRRRLAQRPVLAVAVMFFGMAISRRFARVMGGDLTVTSQLGKGSVFRLEIPVEASE